MDRSFDQMYFLSPNHILINLVNGSLEYNLSDRYSV
jgi:hypothetical protein